MFQKKTFPTLPITITISHVATMQYECCNRIHLSFSAVSDSPSSDYMIMVSKQQRYRAESSEYTEILTLGRNTMATTLCTGPGQPGLDSATSSAPHCHCFTQDESEWAEK